MNIKPLLVPAALALMMGCAQPPAPPAPVPAPVPPAAPAPVAPADTGLVATADVLDVTQRPDGPLLLDVRTPHEFAEGHVPGATNIPVSDLPARLAELEPYRQRGVVTYCQVGGRATTAVETLKGAGFAHVSQMEGSMDRWLSEGRPVEKPPAQ